MSLTPTCLRNWLRWGYSAELKMGRLLGDTMQPVDELSKQTSWGRLLLIGGIICFAFGGILLIGQIGQLPDIVDPNKNNVADVNIGEQISVVLSDSCYVAWSENKSENIGLVIYDSNENKIQKTGCGYDIEAMDAKGSTFQRIGSWELADGTYNVHATCSPSNSSGCNDGNIMLMDHDDAMSKLLGDLGFWSSCGLCFLGIILLPLGVILSHLASRQKIEQNVVLMSDGSFSTIQGYGDEGVSMSRNMDGVENNIGGENDPLLTTDEIYSLMHGNESDKMKILERLDSEYQDVAAPDVPDPFAESKYKNVQIDEMPKEKMEKKIHISKTVETESESSWKDWDEG